jgi:3-deoxy-manno-octulosonate cytidylyltransferase (CMP-KDO synthetase)
MALSNRLMSKLNYRVVIPARYASTRFPGKALALFAGRPLIEHVYERALASNASEVVIATDDDRIAQAAIAFGANVAMTGSGHQSGTDRIAEVAATRGWADEDLVVNVQGDAPLIPSQSIDQVAGLLVEHPHADIATLRTPVASKSEYDDPNVVKVVCDASGRALYFSRASIPAATHGDNGHDVMRDAYRHIGLYSYRVGALRLLAAADSCYLERIERLEQLRALWLGLDIRVGVAEQEQGPDVDTPEDMEAAERFLDKK